MKLASLYEKMVKDFANQTMTDAVAGSSTKLLPSMIYTNGKAYVGIVKSIPSMYHTWNKWPVLALSKGGKGV